MSYLDGNAAAGPLREIFAVDVTTATGQCNGCGRTEVFAKAHVYVDAPGMVARCSSCEQVLLRVVSTPTGIVLDLRGLTYLRLPADT